jgi:hypothetical protein
VEHEATINELIAAKRDVKQLRKDLDKSRQEESKWRSVAEEATSVAEETEKSRSTFEADVTQTFVRRSCLGLF